MLKNFSQSTNLLDLQMPKIIGQDFKSKFTFYWIQLKKQKDTRMEKIPVLKLVVA